MEKISWTDHVRNEEVLQSQGEKEYPIYSKRKKGNWIGHVVCSNCDVKHISEGKIEG
jgi:hypothetical protein